MSLRLYPLEGLWPSGKCRNLSNSKLGRGQGDSRAPAQDADAFNSRLSTAPSSLFLPLQIRVPSEFSRRFRELLCIIWPPPLMIYSQRLITLRIKRAKTRPGVICRGSHQSRLYRIRMDIVDL